MRVSDEESPVLIQAVYDTYDIEHVQQDLDVSTLVFIGKSNCKGLSTCSEVTSLENCRRKELSQMST